MLTKPLSLSGRPQSDDSIAQSDQQKINNSTYTVKSDTSNFFDHITPLKCALASFIVMTGAFI